MNKVLRERALHFLNQMEVIESQGGEETYALVENNEESRYLLTEAGIPLETALKYGDEETFCIVALACSEGYATWYTGDKLIFNEVTVNDIESKIQERMILLSKNNESERLAELGLLLDWIANGEDY
jgi:hypothetical protein